MVDHNSLFFSIVEWLFRALGFSIIERTSYRAGLVAWEEDTSALPIVTKRYRIRRATAQDVVSATLRVSLEKDPRGVALSPVLVVD